MDGAEPRVLPGTVRVLTALVVIAALFATACRSKPEPLPAADGGKDAAAVTASPPPPRASASEAASAAPPPSAAPAVEALECPPPDSADWTLFEGEHLGECGFHYAVHPEAIPIAGRWMPCSAGLPAGCLALDLPLPIRRDAVVDASREPARALLSFKCGGVVSVVLDADGSPPKWSVASSQGNRCDIRNVAVEGRTVMAVLLGDVSRLPEDNTDGPAQSIVFAQDLGRTRVQHRVQANSRIDHLVADREHWANLNPEGLWAAKLGEDRRLVAAKPTSHEQLRLLGATAVYRSSEGTNDTVEGWSATATERATFPVAVVQDASILGLGLGPRGTVMWSERSGAGCVLARAQAREHADVARFAVPCPLCDERWLISQRYAALVHDGDRVTVLRLADNVAVTLRWPRDEKGYCHTDLLAVNDHDLYGLGTSRGKKTILRVPLPSFDGAQPLVGVAGHDEPDAGLSAAAPDASPGADASVPPGVHKVL